MINWLWLFIVTTSLLYGAPAFDGERQFHQPDGTSFSGRQRGDEYLHWIESDSGDILLFDRSSQRFEHTEIIDGKLQTDGRAFHHEENTKRSAQGLNSSSDVEALKSLWQRSRQQALERKRQTSLRGEKDP